VIFLKPMNEEEFRKHQISRDQKALDGKVKRWKQIVPATYGQKLPKLMWEYLNITDDMFIDGHFMGVVLLCAAILELLLTDQLIEHFEMTEKEVERFTLEQMVILAYRLRIITDLEKNAIDKLRQLRNPLIHANVGKISKMARQSSSTIYEGLESEFYIAPLSDESGIRVDALKYLCFTRDLTVKFYGDKTMGV
jgi:hypothetical protein